MSELILYTTEDGKSRIQLRTRGQTVWLSQREMAELFDVSTDNIGLHLKNIYEDGELLWEATTEDSSVVQLEGRREVQRTLTLYNLDAILAVGYRVRSPRGTQFRRWASTILKEYLLKGFVIDDQRLKNPDGRPDHFDELLAKIREIRASEKRFYQKVKELFVLSTDYDKSDRSTHQFFATVQNLLLYAVTQKGEARAIDAASG
ncbi:MAG TPA: RhuM family protein, partial [Myxococcota bacterium]|nr:RhuM family protein [Myxococcota bacterium]